MSVVGGEDVLYDTVEITNTNAAGLYIACENGDFVTRPVHGVVVRNGRITGANSNAAIDHGAILVYSARPDGGVSDVTVSTFTITGTRPSASRQIGVVADSSDDPVSGVAFSDLVLAAAPAPYQGNAPVSDVSLQNVLADGKPVHASVSR